MMDSRSTWITRCSLLLACLLLLTGAAPAPSHALDNEDIVRMTAHRMPPAEIVRAIREAAAVAFDLDPEVLAELRVAGVDETVIEAMRSAAAARAPASSPGPAPAREARGTIALRLEGGAEGAEGGSLSLPDGVYAFFLFCTDPTHVPDFWQGRTRLAEEVGRHHLLWFQEAPAPEAGKRRGRIRPVALPAPVELKEAPGPHPLVAGVAMRDAKERWVPIGAAERTLEVPDGGAARLVVRIRTTRAPGKPPLVVEILEPPQAPADIKR